jgi:hypothetical protein
MRFHSLYSNTNHYLPPHAANNFPCGVPKKFEDDEIPFSWDAKPPKETKNGSEGRFRPCK